ncbi:hypothetical protein GIB67_007340 [Kingdonia uniflora]|uniref:Arabinanase/levansucrase/invertase n=1 Tax=Kingdonia uniflora TaxID=39325 RepID=A0A7J7NXD5_9MAGN|nr:hypothetical protein GIB67_007340 [Kingdonia uniflora]
MHDLHVYSSRTNNTHIPILTRCSTKPDIGNDPIIETDSIETSFLQASNPTKKPQFPSPLCPRGLVFDLGPNGSWDSQEVGYPVVKRFVSDDEERWYMWYHGRGEEGRGDAIGLAISSNGVHWERGMGSVQSNADVGLAMNFSLDWWGFDTLSVRPSDVVIMSSSKVRTSSAVYWLYYTGFNSEKIEFNVGVGVGGDGTDVFKSLPGLAISQDGRHWARIEGEHHTGALFDVGQEKEWDSLFVAAPKVVYHTSGDLRMYYHSFDIESSTFCVGIARSRDGMKWVKLGKIMGGGVSGGFDEFGVMNSHVVRYGKDRGYIMAYEGVAADGARSIGLAVSPDGLKDWKRFGDGAILQRSVEEDGWDNKGVGSPCLVQMDGENDEWRLYYRGIGIGGRTSIGMAVSEGSKVTSFRKWTGFHL